MPTGKKISPKDKKKMTQMLAKGTSQKAIANKIGLNQSAVSRHLKNNKEKVEFETQRLVDSLPDIIDQTIQDLKTSAEVSKTLAGENKISDLPEILQDSKILTKFMELAYKNKVDILKALQVFPSAQNTFTQNIFNKGANAIISPNILSILGEHIKHNIEDNIEDAEIVED